MASTHHTSTIKFLQLLYILITITIHIIPTESFTTVSRTGKPSSFTTKTPSLFTKDYETRFHHTTTISNYKQNDYYSLNKSNKDNALKDSHLYSSQSMDIASPSSDDDNKDEGTTLDKVLSKLTSAFPLFVLSSAVLGYAYPKSLHWVSTSANGELITCMLACVMVTMGMTLETKDFEKVIIKQKRVVPIGIMCQFVIMPILACILGKALILPIDKALYLGFVLVGCVPGGTASNLVALIAGADVALSVVLTSISTLLASFGKNNICKYSPFIFILLLIFIFFALYTGYYLYYNTVTPLLVKLIIGTTVNVSGYKLFEATSKVVFLPIIIGMILNAKGNIYTTHFI